MVWSGMKQTVDAVWICTVRSPPEAHLCVSGGVWVYIHICVRLLHVCSSYHTGQFQSLKQWDEQPVRLSRICFITLYRQRGAARGIRKPSCTSLTKRHWRQSLYLLPVAATKSTHQNFPMAAILTERSRIPFLIQSQILLRSKPMAARTAT